jgi:DHA1 family tetracycline resistance protein-like MFS transporter
MSDVPVDPPSPAPPRGALQIIFLIVFMDLLGFGIIIPLLPLYALDYHASVLQVGFLFAIYSACQFVASPVLGAISDRVGRRPVLVFSQLGSAAGYLLLGIVMSLHWLHPGYALLLIYVSRIIDGFSGGNVSTAQAYVSDVTTPQNRAKGMGVLGAAFGFGFAMGPALGALLVLVHRALPGYFAAAMSLGALVQTYLRLPESRVHKPAQSVEWLHPRRFLPIFRQRRLIQLLFIAFFSMVAYAILQTIVALFLNDRRTFGFKYWQVALFYAYLGIVILIVQGGFISRLTRRFGEWPLATLGPILASAGMGLMGLAGYEPRMVILLLGGATNAVGRSLQTPTLYALISHNSDRREQGVVFGLNQGFSGIAQIIGPILATLTFGFWISGPFLLAAAIVLMVAGWTMRLRRQSGESAIADMPADPAAESL